MLLRFLILNSNRDNINNKEQNNEFKGLDIILSKGLKVKLELTEISI